MATRKGLEGGWIAHRGVLAAEAEVVKRRRKEAIERRGYVRF